MDTESLSKKIMTNIYIGQHEISTMHENEET